MLPGRNGLLAACPGVSGFRVPVAPPNASSRKIEDATEPLRETVLKGVAAFNG
jgi:hypothetical protein